MVTLLFGRENPNDLLVKINYVNSLVSISNKYIFLVYRSIMSEIM